MNNTEPETRVIFRKFLDHKDTHYGDGIIALFPDEPGTNDPGTCSSYMHVGQHGAASMSLVYGEPRTTRPASPEEYADLKRELERPPYSYRLKVIRRTPKDSAEIRRMVLDRSRGGIQTYDAAGTERKLRLAGLCNHQTGYGLPWMTYCGLPVPCPEHPGDDTY